MAKRSPFVLVYCAASHPSHAERMIEDMVNETAKFRNGRHFKPEDIEYRNGLQVVSAVYTNNPDIRAAYENLNGQRVNIGGNWATLNIPVRPIAPPVSDNLPTEDDLNALTMKQLEDEYGVPQRVNGRRRKKSDMIQEILEG